jgi:hypothetical protein
MNGIPARWQSGWCSPMATTTTMHDWGQVYLAPYGWVPMDVTTGQLASDDPDLRWFYLGGLDAYRVTFNDAISQPFVPAKRFVRSKRWTTSAAKSNGAAAIFISINGPTTSAGRCCLPAGRDDAGTHHRSTNHGFT